MTTSAGRLSVSILLLCIGSMLSGCGYNTIPTLDEQAKARWSDVQNQYQRRADLIPNLVATVQGYAKQEKDVLTAVVEARAKATQIKVDASQLTDPEKVKQFLDAQNQLTGALGRLLALRENYPDLKSNANFLALQSQLEARKTASRSRAAITSKRFAPTIPRSGRFRASFGPRPSSAASRWRNLLQTKARRRRHRLNSKRPPW